MTPMTVRGLPRSLSKDAWWIAADSQSGVGRGGVVPSRPWWLLELVVALVDACLFHSHLGLGFVAAIFSVAAAAHFVLRRDVSSLRALVAWAVLIAALLPAVDLVQWLSFALAFIGLAVFAGLISGPRWGQAARRLLAHGLGQWVRDMRAAELRGPSRRLVLDWAMPVVVGVVFVGLMATANPLVENWMSQFDLRQGPDIERVIFWAVVALIAWPFLRLAQMNLHFVSVKSARKPVSVAYLNPRSVLRALIVFNVIFAVQTVMDLGYLWGGVRLPEGMTYANYAHRGAYPLMVTALLAGAFALAAQPWLDSRKMRVLLLVWVGQTVMLVISSILRLDLYVDVYGLTLMRFAAFIWMSVVALGLIVLVMQTVQRQSTGWMLTRAFGAVYLCLLVNVSGFVARHQLTVGPLDAGYVCSLRDGAAVEVARFAPDLCIDRYYDLTVYPPQGWRDWGFRNARLRRSLDVIKAEAGQ
ncbi:MAG: DUF4173 domain-containing protein [Yoonia sp.]|nr:DUF4173 domain-containing protein [Yoonia sp.]